MKLTFPVAIEISFNEAALVFKDERPSVSVDSS